MTPNPSSRILRAALPRTQSLHHHHSPPHAHAPHDYATYNTDGSWTIGPDTYTHVILGGYYPPTPGRTYPCTFGDPQNRREPFILIPSPSLSHMLPFPQAVIAAWYCEHADFARSRAQQSPPFLTATLTPATIPSGGRFHRWHDSYRLTLIPGDSISVPQTPGEITPRATWSFTGSDAQLALGLSNGAYETAYNETYPLDPGQERTHEIDSVEERSYSIVNGVIYLVISYRLLTTATTDGSTDYTDEATTEVLFALNADPDGSTITKLWAKNYATLVDYNTPSQYDVIISSGRAAIFFEGPYLWHLNATDGTDPQEVDLSTIETTANQISLTASNVTAPFYASSDGSGKVWFGGGGTALTCVNLLTNAILWSVGGTTTSDTLTVYEPSKICPESGTWLVIKEQTDYERIVDNVFSTPIETAWVDTPVTVPVERDPEIARGHSQRAYYCAIDLATGDEISATLMAGTESAGSVTNERTEYTTQQTIPSWTAPANPVNPSTGDPLPLDYSHDYTPKLLTLGNVFAGETATPDPGTNVTGTSVEGVSGSSTVAGSFAIGLGGATIEAELSRTDTASAFTYVSDWMASVLNPAINARCSAPVGAPSDYIPSAQQVAANVETSRATNGDRIRWEAWKLEFSNLAVFSGWSTGSPVIEYSQAFTQVYVRESAYQRDGVPPDPSARYADTFTIPAGDCIPQGEIPDRHHLYDYDSLTGFGTSASIEFFDAMAAWGGVGGDSADPLLGLRTVGMTGPSTSGGHSVSITYRQYWEPIGTTTPRTRTTRPVVSWSNSLTYGSTSVILCPLYEAGGTSPMRWVALSQATGEPLWEQTSHTGFYTLGSILVDGKILTPYQLGSTTYLMELDALTGDILSDQAVPGNPPIYDLIYGDGVLWAPIADYGVEGSA